MVERKIALGKNLKNSNKFLKIYFGNFEEIVFCSVVTSDEKLFPVRWTCDHQLSVSWPMKRHTGSFSQMSRLSTDSGAYRRSIRRTDPRGRWSEDVWEVMQRRSRWRRLVERGTGECVMEEKSTSPLSKGGRWHPIGTRGTYSVPSGLSPDLCHLKPIFRGRKKGRCIITPNDLHSFNNERNQ